MSNYLFAFVLVATAMLAIGCDNKAEPPARPTETPKPEAKAPAGDHSGKVVELGETTIEGMKVKASRDKVEIKPGGDAPIDIWINGGLGDVSAVRFWIGTEDAKGSVKAKADVEAGHWHTHAEVPEPLPGDAKLWVEIEGKNGATHKVSFSLNL